ncbi:MAG: hypothetical protein M1822_001504 [Bathelium mastoideum]|nr:MAG: hypothetical protein M1822_001504 [Bathelium mastoideum]
MSAKASGAAGGPNGEARHRTHHDGSSGRAFTVEQKAAVIRVKRCKATAFYDILGLEEVKATATDTDIKKAYRKLSLLTHPDKNGYDGADEAFKMVSRAFQILSDPDKKKKFDTFGGDPESRFGSAGGGGGGGGPGPSSPFSNFARANGTPGRGGMFEEDISPEELFRQFFGGGMGGGGFGTPFGGGLFDTGPGFIFNLNGQNFGGPGVRVHQFGGGRPRRRPHAHDSNTSESSSPPNPLQTLASLLPLLLLFLLPLLSSLFSSFSSSTPTGPAISFASAPPHTLARTSGNLQIPYFVNPAEVSEYSSAQWRRLDRAAETHYLGGLRQECEAETQARQRLEQEAQGFFWQDTEKMERARRMEMRSCRRLRELSGGYYF